MESRDDLYQYVNINSSNSFHESLNNIESQINHSYNTDVSSSSDKEYIGDSVNDTTLDDKKYRFYSRIFLGISIVSAVVVLVLESYVYAVINIHRKRIDSDVKYKELSIFLGLFIFAAIYQVLLTVVGIMRKNILLLSFLCGFYACMLIYTGIQYQEVNDVVGDVLQGAWKTATRATNIVTIVIIAVTMVLQIYLIVGHLRNYVGWFRYKTIGADLNIRKMYRILYTHRSLLIFDFFFFVGFTLQFIIIMVQDKLSTEFILTVCVLPLTIILLLVSDYVYIKEIIWLAVPCLLVYLAGIAYVLFKMIRLFTQYTSAYDLTVKPGDYFPGRSSLITFGVITLLFLLATVVFEVLLMKNFNRGLKNVIGKSPYWIFNRKHTDAGTDSSEKLVIN